MSVHVSSVSSFDFPSDKIIIADINFFVKLDTAERYASERPPAYRGGSFLLQREQRHGLQRVAAAYNLSTGVDSRATHGILWITSGRYPPGFFSDIYGSVLIAIMVTATFRAIPFPYR